MSHDAIEARKLRRQLESFHGSQDAAAVVKAWPHLAHPDPWIRHAARVAIEHQPVSQWRGKALQEQDPLAAVTALLALARVGLVEDRDPLLARAAELPWNAMSSQSRIIILRSLSIALARHGRPDDSKSLQLVEKLDRCYPDESPEANQLLCELLVALKSPQVVAKTLSLIAAAKTQEEKFHYLVTLRHVPGPWNPNDRRKFVTWLREARDFYGAQYLPRYLQWLKSDIAATFTVEEHRLFDDLLKEQPPAAEVTTQIQRPYVRNWQLDDLAGSLDAISTGRSFQRGQETFAAALCVRCHRLGQTGSPVGPDLTEVARRFGRRDLLLSILAPSHVIDDKYRATTFVTRNGQVIAGQVTGQSDIAVTVLPNLLFPESVIRVPVDDIESQTPALTSTMPAGLLNTFTKEEILDLLAYIESAGKPNHPAFRSDK